MNTINKPTRDNVFEDFLIVVDDADNALYRTRIWCVNAVHKIEWRVIYLLFYITFPVWVWFRHKIQNFGYSESGEFVYPWTKREE